MVSWLLFNKSKNIFSSSIFYAFWYSYLKDSCISVFCEEQEKEVALLHSDNCVNDYPCEQYPPDIQIFIRDDDENN